MNPVLQNGAWFVSGLQGCKPACRAVISSRKLPFFFFFINKIVFFYRLEQLFPVLKDPI